VAQVVWTKRALADLMAIREYIGQFSPLAAQRIAARLRSAAESLAEHPERGRLATATLRELVVVPPYEDAVRIVRIRHAAQL
jgi:plasmid stabilization system protein ParE